MVKSMRTGDVIDSVMIFHCSFCSARLSFNMTATEGVSLWESHDLIQIVGGPIWFKIDWINRKGGTILFYFRHHRVDLSCLILQCVSQPVSFDTADRCSDQSMLDITDALDWKQILQNHILLSIQCIISFRILDPSATFCCKRLYFLRSNRLTSASCCWISASRLGSRWFQCRTAGLQCRYR